MEENTPYKLERATIVQISVAIAAALVVLLVFNYKNIYSYQDMAQDVQSKLISESGVNAVLMTYRNTEQAVEIKVTLIGLTKALPTYENDVLRFVCTHPILIAQLRDDFPVEVTLVATRTKQDKYLTLLVNPSMCAGSR
jgi:hypothetical protein